MNTFEHPGYNDCVADLIDRAALNELGPGKPDHAQRARLDQLSPEQLLAPHPVRDRQMAEACLAGLWLLHDFLDESHTISQSIDTLEGSYWHGIMHRREPDYENAKYWFRRVPVHPLYAPLACAAHELAVAAAPDARADFCALRRNGTRLPLSICAGQLPAADRQAGNSAGRCNGWNGRCFSTIAGGRRGAKLEGGARSGLPGT